MSTPVYRYRDVMPEEDFPFKLEIRTQAEFNRAVHAHEHLQLNYVSRGAWLHQLGGSEALVCEGDFFFIPPFFEHRVAPAGGADCEMIQIDFMPFFLTEHVRAADKIDDFVDFAYIGPLAGQYGQPLPRLTFAPQQRGRVEQLIDSMRAELQERDEEYRLAIKADLLKLLVLAGRAYRQCREPGRETADTAVGAIRESLHGAIDYIDAHYTGELRLEDAAAIAHMSPTYFSSVFKLTKGVGFSEYVNRKRIRKAAELLSGSGLSVTEIVFEAGYNNVAHFNKTFKKLTGLTPTEYRRL